MVGLGWYEMGWDGVASGTKRRGREGQGQALREMEAVQSGREREREREFSQLCLFGIILCLYTPPSLPCPALACSAVHLSSIGIIPRVNI